MLRQPLLQLLDVLEQPGAGQTKEVEAEFRILHVKLLDLGVADAEDETALDAFQRLGSHVRRRQHAEFADDGADRQLDAGFHQLEAARDDVEHVLGLLVLVEQHLAGGAFALGHERLQPVHRQVAVDRLLHVPHQLQHLVQPVGIEHQHQRLHHDDQVIAARDRGRDQDEVGEDAEDPQRDHGPHRGGRDHEDRCEDSARRSGVLGEIRGIHGKPASSKRVNVLEKFRCRPHRNDGGPLLIYGERATIGWGFRPIRGRHGQNAGFRFRSEGREVPSACRVLAARCARGLPGRFAPHSEGAGKTGCALHPRSRVQNCAERSAHEHTGSAETLRPSLRNGFTAYLALAPEYRAFMPPSPRENRHVGPVGLFAPPRDLTPTTEASGPHDFAVR